MSVTQDYKKALETIASGLGTVGNPINPVAVARNALDGAADVPQAGCKTITVSKVEREQIEFALEARIGWLKDKVRYDQEEIEYYKEALAAAEAVYSRVVSA